jgi:hypothetical protein
VVVAFVLLVRIRGDRVDIAAEAAVEELFNADDRFVSTGLLGVLLLLLLFVWVLLVLVWVAATDPFLILPFVLPSLLLLAVLFILVSAMMVFSFEE